MADSSKVSEHTDDAILPDTSMDFHLHLLTVHGELGGSACEWEHATWDGRVTYHDPTGIAGPNRNHRPSTIDHRHQQPCRHCIDRLVADNPLGTSQ